MDEDRLVEIETRLAFQEDTMQQLNDVICRQRDQIDRLAASAEALRGQLGEIAAKLPDEEGEDEKPPHY